MKKLYDLIANPSDFPAAMERATRLGQMDALEGKPRQVGINEFCLRVASAACNGQKKPLKVAYNAGYWVAETLIVKAG